MNKQEREAVVKQGIIGLILKWKLSSAEVDLTKNEGVLTDPTRKELKGLLEQQYICHYKQFQEYFWQS